MMISSYSPLLQTLPTHTQQQRLIHMVSTVIFSGKFRALLHKIQIGPIQHYITLITLQTVQTNCNPSTTGVYAMSACTNTGKTSTLTITK